jgi:hypothetical protein
MLDQITSRKTLYDAFARVQENGGCRGADGVTLGHFHTNLETELDSLQDSGKSHANPISPFWHTGWNSDRNSNTIKDYASFWLPGNQWRG